MSKSSLPHFAELRDGKLIEQEEGSNDFEMIAPTLLGAIILLGGIGLFWVAVCWPAAAIPLLEVLHGF
jgi:hypothetical protein